jgi:hypothetical protein
MDMGPMGQYRIFGADGVPMGGMMDEPENVPGSAWCFYVNVDGVDAAVDRIVANGGQVLMGAARGTGWQMDRPGGGSAARRLRSRFRHPLKRAGV